MPFSIEDILDIMLKYDQSPASEIEQEKVPEEKVIDKIPEKERAWEVQEKGERKVQKIAPEGICTMVQEPVLEKVQETVQYPSQLNFLELPATIHKPATLDTP